MQSTLEFSLFVASTDYKTLM
uniref:Uncharacterized protein n=1 Tax=Amphimedon queenslandica TaxID=400682 RepID=A0A1X7T3P3_AMPQE